MITSRRCWIEFLSSLRDFELWLDNLPSHKWLGYFQDCGPGFIALGGRKNKAQVGDKGIDGRIFPVSALDNVREAGAGELALEERFYAMQVKQKDKTGRPDIDAFETAMRRAKCEKGFFVSFDYSSDALREIDRFFREEHRIIIPLTVREILDEEIARKLA